MSSESFMHRSFPLDALIIAFVSRGAHISDDGAGGHISRQLLHSLSTATTESLLRAVRRHGI